ncbi:MAG: hypothetical protein WKF97_18485 [Chitinophagaceae bacterium]
MKRDFDDDDSFELFIQKKVDHYKMYPSEGVWKGIYNTLHTRRKWFTIGGSLLLLTAIIFITQELLFPGSSTLEVNRPTGQTISLPLITRLEALPFSTHSFAGRSSTKKLIEKPVAGLLQMRDPSATNRRKADQVTIKSLDINKSQVKLTAREAVSSPVVTALHEKEQMQTKPVVASKISNSPEISLVDKMVVEKDPALSDKNDQIPSEKKTNWLQEMALIRLTPPKKNRFNLQFYLSPTISYRKLADNGNKINVNQQNVPLAINHTNIDRYVDHVPSVGVELGSNVLYSVFENLTLKTGLQLNYSRYNIKAYSFYYEKASIALNRAGLGTDTISAYTSLRNFNGYSPEQLQNQYLQVSLPVGAELKLLGNKRLQLNIAGTIQPTYLLFNDTYLLSMDYVNYAKEESLVRKWNVHTSVEAFISYKTGGVRWQLGPQFRYQLMSSYNDRYPIKEYLIEYAAKIGISKTIK